MTASRSPLLAVAAALALAGCGGGRHYIRPNSDLSTIETVCILPFENVTTDKLAGERVQRVFLSELLNLGAFDVVEPGLTAQLVRRGNLDVSTAGPEELKRLGAELKAQGVFIGSVIEFEEGRAGANAAPRVTLHLRLVEVDTGRTVWSIQRTAGGMSLAGRLFGTGGTTATKVAEELIRGQLKELL